MYIRGGSIKIVISDRIEDLFGPLQLQSFEVGNELRYRLIPSSAVALRWPAADWFINGAVNERIYRIVLPGLEVVCSHHIRYTEFGRTGLLLQ